MLEGSLKTFIEIPNQGIELNIFRNEILILKALKNSYVKHLWKIDLSNEQDGKGYIIALRFNGEMPIDKDNFMRFEEFKYFKEFNRVILVGGELYLYHIPDSASIEFFASKIRNIIETIFVYNAKEDVIDIFVTAIPENFLSKLFFSISGRCPRNEQAVLLFKMRG